MSANELIQSYIDEIMEGFDVIRSNTKELEVTIHGIDLLERAKCIENCNNNILMVEKIFTKKFTERLINRCGDNTQKLFDRKAHLEESFQTLKSHFHEITNDSIHLKKVTGVVNTIDPDLDLDVIARREEAIFRRMNARELHLHEFKEEPHESVTVVLKEQQVILESLMRSKNINIETIKIADRVSEKLREQTEEMERIQVKLDSLGDGLTRARKEAGALVRGIATDKAILGLICCLILVCLILLAVRIGYAVYQKTHGIVELFPRPVGQKPIVTSSSLHNVFRYNGGNILWG
jgi:hypothetical protein